MRRFVGLVLIVVGAVATVAGLIDPILLIPRIPEAVHWLSEKSGLDLLKVKVALAAFGFISMYVGGRLLRRR